MNCAVDTLTTVPWTHNIRINIISLIPNKQTQLSAIQHKHPSPSTSPYIYTSAHASTPLHLPPPSALPPFNFHPSHNHNLIITSKRRAPLSTVPHQTSSKVGEKKPSHARSGRARTLVLCPGRPRLHAGIRAAGYPGRRASGAGRIFVFAGGMGGEGGGWRRVGRDGRWVARGGVTVFDGVRAG